MKYSTLALAFASTAFGQSLTEVLSANPNLSQLVQLIGDQADALGSQQNVTLLAPNNSAIEAFLQTPTAGALSSDPQLVQAILQYHVLQGNYSNITNASFIATSLQEGQYANVTGGQRVEALPSGGNVTFFSGLLQNSSVINASIPYDNGVIHVIDQLLTLPQNVSATLIAANLTSAYGAIQALNLTDAINNTPDVTLFIPNNAAFQRIGGNLQNLSTEELTTILQYHVIAGQVAYSTEIENGTSVQALGGDANLTITTDGSDVFVNNAQVIFPDILVANGVVHVIDRVLNPANATLAANPSTTEEAFAGATSASEEPYTSGVPTPTSALNTEAASSAQESAAGETSSGGAWRPIETGAIGMAALFGGAAAVMNM